MTPTCSDAAPTKRGDTRKKMLISAAEVMRERGAAGVTIDAVLAHSGAPARLGVPPLSRGRNQILVEALRYAGDSITEIIDDAADRGARVLVRKFVEYWERRLSDGGFNAGCPVVAAALGSADEEPQLCSDAGAILGRLVYRVDPGVRLRWLQRGGCGVAVGDVDRGLGRDIMLCRSTRSAAPLRQVGDQLEFLIKAREFVARTK